MEEEIPERLDMVFLGFRRVVTGFDFPDESIRPIDHGGELAGSFKNSHSYSMTKTLTPESALSIIERVAQTPSGYRRGHSRGLALRGSFQATPEAKNMTTAEHFQGGSIPCLVRLSNAAGNPCAPDRNSDSEGRVLGLAVAFELPSGARPTWTAINIPAFPARTPEEFIALTEAQETGKTGKPNMLKILWHVVRHLHILTSVKHIKALKPCASLSAETYHGIHTYYFVDAQGNRKAFRYRWIPNLDLASLDPKEAGAKPKLYLLDELRARLTHGPLVWDLEARFAKAGDALDDASVAWPEDRPSLPLGRLTVDRVHENQHAVDGMVFDPSNTVAGIDLSQDPILHFRTKAYGLSYDRRSKEKRVEPAPVDMGLG